ncbi:unnamed protein product [Brachionus calyciflorus]|uniref:Uncharacterized protein n=1 Tax=Brachionus calyciflorus TaxID=104777 RepID=A0A813XWH7_9BILA|nr:unnamed protein product [Brachionus calyciflorus]
MKNTSSKIKLFLLLAIIALISSESSESIEDNSSSKSDEMISLIKTYAVQFQEHSIQKRNVFTYSRTTKPVKSKYFYDILNKTVAYINKVSLEKCTLNNANLRFWDILPICYKQYFIKMVNVSTFGMTDFKWDHLKPDTQEKILSLKDFIANVEGRSEFFQQINMFMGDLLVKVNFDICLSKVLIKEHLISLVNSEFEFQLNQLTDLKINQASQFGFDLLTLLIRIVMN